MSLTPHPAGIHIYFCGVLPPFPGTRGAGYTEEPFSGWSKEGWAWPRALCSQTWGSPSGFHPMSLSCAMLWVSPHPSAPGLVPHDVPLGFGGRLGCWAAWRLSSAEALHVTLFLNIPCSSTAGKAQRPQRLLLDYSQCPGRQLRLELWHCFCCGPRCAAGLW